MSSVDWSARPDQIEGLALREVTVRVFSYPPELEPNLNQYDIEIRSHLRTIL